MARTIHLDTLQKIYIAFYQRPGDPAGIRYWADRLAQAQGDSTAIVDAFAASVEAQALYGRITPVTLGSVIDKVYQALFLREPDAEGKAFYQAAFAQGTLTVGNIVLAILHGAQDEDLDAIENKLVVAREFTQQVDGREYHHAAFGNGWDAAYAYAGKDDAVMARSMLAGVTADPATVLDAAAITRILQGVKPEGEGAGAGVIAPAGNAVISFVTGDEDDTIAVEVDGTGRSNVSVWVDAGAGDDLITVNNTGPVRVTLYAGAGNDTVVLADGVDSIAAHDAFDGGAGVDTLVLPGGLLVQGDYVALARSAVGFERIAFTGKVELDAGQLQQFREIGFAAGISKADIDLARLALEDAEFELIHADDQVPKDPVLIKRLTDAVEAARHALDITLAEKEAGGSLVVGVSEGQLLVAGGNLSAWAEGYRQSSRGSEVSDAEEDTNPAGTLNVVSQGAGSTIAAYGGLLNLTVMAVEGGEVATWLKGDVARADIMLAGQSRAGPLDDAPTEVASVVIETGSDALSGLASITVEGIGCVRIHNYDGSALDRVDVSAMRPMPALGASFFSITDGLIYLSSNSKAETIVLGAGADWVKLENSTVGSPDTVVDLNLVAKCDMPGVLDMYRSDRLVLGKFEGIEEGFETLDALNIGTLDFDGILASAAAHARPVVFHWNEDTFVFAGGDNGQVDDTDVLVRLVGELDLGLLVFSLESPLAM